MHICNIQEFFFSFCFLNFPNKAKGSIMRFVQWIEDLKRFIESWNTMFHIWGLFTWRIPLPRFETSCIFALKVKWWHNPLGSCINIWVVIIVSFFFFLFGLYKLGFCRPPCQHTALPWKVFLCFLKSILNFPALLSTVPLISWKVNWATGVYWELNF